MRMSDSFFGWYLSGVSNGVCMDMMNNICGLFYSACTTKKPMSYALLLVNDNSELPLTIMNITHFTKHL